MKRRESALTLVFRQILDTIHMIAIVDKSHLAENRKRLSSFCLSLETHAIIVAATATAVIIPLSIFTVKQPHFHLKICNYDIICCIDK